ncbi:glycosyltransferase [Halopseudomonas bauzanensis]|uniref:glycosyltransferase n=1 Tax=Halopseudomonas bauzanensis TaxID=653930 RepID=UPI002555840B|nr:glycosyltransferase [Halopseudomonas bauzanensis]
MDHFALFIPTMGGGGAERVIMLLANGLAARGYKVDLLLIKAEGPYLTSVSPNVRIIDLKSKRVSTSLIALVRYLRREKPNTLLSALRTCNIVSVLAKKMSFLPLILIISEHSNFQLAQGAGTKWRAFLLHRLMRWTYAKANHIVAVSTGVARELEHGLGLDSGCVSAIYNPVVTPALKKLASESTSHAWFTDEAVPIIISVGRLVGEKDYPTLIQAFALVRKKRNSRLLILGEGVLRTRLEKLVIELGLEDCVAMPGFVSNPLPYMKSSAVFVISSALEAFGNVLVEAMACGTPVVATAASGPAEILENGKWGRLVAIGDIEKLADAIIESLDGVDFIDATERAALFTVDTAIDRYLSVMHNDK